MSFKNAPGCECCRFYGITVAPPGGLTTDYRLVRVTTAGAGTWPGGWGYDSAYELVIIGQSARFLYVLEKVTGAFQVLKIRTADSEIIWTKEISDWGYGATDNLDGAIPAEGIYSTAPLACDIGILLWHDSKWRQIGNDGEILVEGTYGATPKFVIELPPTATNPWVEVDPSNGNLTTAPPDPNDKFYRMFSYQHDDGTGNLTMRYALAYREIIAVEDDVGTLINQGSAQMRRFSHAGRFRARVVEFEFESDGGGGIQFNEVNVIQEHVELCNFFTWETVPGKTPFTVHNGAWRPVGGDAYKGWVEGLTSQNRPEFHATHEGLIEWNMSGGFCGYNGGTGSAPSLREGTLAGSYKALDSVTTLSGTFSQSGSDPITSSIDSTYPKFTQHGFWLGGYMRYAERIRCYVEETAADTFEGTIISRDPDNPLDDITITTEYSKQPPGAYDADLKTFIAGYLAIKEVRSGSPPSEVYGGLDLSDSAFDDVFYIGEYDDVAEGHKCITDDFFLIRDAGIGLTLSGNTLSGVPISYGSIRLKDDPTGPHGTLGVSCSHAVPLPDLLT